MINVKSIASRVLRDFILVNFDVKTRHLWFVTLQVLYSYNHFKTILMICLKIVLLFAHLYGTTYCVGIKTMKDNERLLESGGLQSHFVEDHSASYLFWQGQKSSCYQLLPIFCDFGSTRCTLSCARSSFSSCVSFDC